VRFGASLAANVEGHVGDVGEFDVDEEPRCHEAFGVEFGYGIGHVILLGFREEDGVVDFVVGHCCGCCL
jgi:hypothetical protein